MKTICKINVSAVKKTANCVKFEGNDTTLGPYKSIYLSKDVLGKAFPDGKVPRNLILTVTAA